MKKLAAVLILCGALCFAPKAHGQAGTPPGAYSPSGGGGTTTSSGIPGSPGITAVPVQSGLMAEYRILPSETPATLVDYSGNSNNAVGTADTAPTIIATSGGINCAGAGAVKLPAAVNSAKTIQIFLSFQDSGNSQVYNAPIAGNGLAATSAFFTFRTVNNAGATSNPVVWRTYTNSSVRAISYSPFNGTGLVSVTMGASLDALYYNGSNVTDAPNTVSTSSGGQTTGQFQLCGVSAAVNIGVPAYMFGNIYYAVFYNRVLTATEIAANSAFISQAMAARGITTSFGSTPTTDELSALGDSLTLGGPPSTFWPIMIVGNLVGANWLAQDWAQGNQLAAQGAGIAGNASTTGNNAGLASMFHPAANRNLFSMWAATNDFALQSDTATHIAAYQSQFCNHVHAIGSNAKCLVATMLSRNLPSNQDANKALLNPLIRSQWPNYADIMVDVASIPALGATGASTGAGFSDQVHPTQGEYYNDIAQAFQRGINRYYGKKDFSSATVYVAPAAAAVATTAGSEATNTVTITFAATPANCLVGNTILIAGTTPAGYSNTTGWTILTRSATQITYFNDTTGLGVITVQGTGVCPQQQDVDMYSIVNFGAGNFSLESCVGYTGQNIYIRDINGVATTLLPFSAETITGTAAPTTVATNTTAILQAQLVSDAAGGCNWVRLQ